MDNPYASPAVETVASPPIRLYSPGHVAWATFLGAPIAGCVLLALNYRRLGHAAVAYVTVITGLAATALTLVIAFFLPDKFPNSVLPAAYTFGMYQFAKTFQGKDYAYRLANGGEKGSGWVATGIGIACLILVVAAILAVVLVMPEQWLGEEMP